MTRMRKSQLERIARSYESYFPGWSRDSRSFQRESGILIQRVWFDSVSFGGYRILNTVEVCILPKGRIQVIAEDLSIKYRVIDPKRFTGTLEDVASCMDTDFTCPPSAELSSKACINTILQYESPSVGHVVGGLALSAYTMDRESLSRLTEQSRRPFKDAEEWMDDWLRTCIQYAGAIIDAAWPEGARSIVNASHEDWCEINR